MYRENHPFEKPVIKSASVLLFDAQPCGGEEFRLVAVGYGFLCERIPFCGGVAQAEVADGVFAQSPFFPEIAQSYSPSFRGVQEGPGKIFRGEFVYEHHAFALHPARYLFGRLFLFHHVDVVFGGKPFEGLGIRKVLVFHYEMDRIASFAAAEAFEYSLARRD